MCHGMLVNEAADVEFVVFRLVLYQCRQLIKKTCNGQVLTEVKWLVSVVRMRRENFPSKAVLAIG